MVILQYNNNNNNSSSSNDNANSMKALHPEAGVLVAGGVPSLKSLPVGARDANASSSTRSDITGVATSPGLSSFESVTSFRSTRPGQSQAQGSKKQPPAPPPKTSARKPRMVSFKDEVDSEQKSVSDMRKVFAELSREIVDNQSPVMKNISTSEDTTTCHSEKSNTTDSCPVTCEKVVTKFPNSFVATKKNKLMPRSQMASPAVSCHMSQSSVLSDSSDSSFGSAKTQYSFEAEEAVTSFQSVENLEAMPLLALNRSLGHLFSRSSMSSTCSSSSSNSSRSSGFAPSSSASCGSSVLSASSPLSIKTSPVLPHGLSPMLLSPSSSSLSSTSSQGLSSLDASSGSVIMLENRCSDPIPEVPEYDEVGASCCEKCSEGKCRTVYLHIPDLPFGWEKVDDPHYGVYYIDHVNRRTQYENPILMTKNQAGDEVTNTFPRHKKASESGAKRSASENNMQSQLSSPGRPFFTKNPEELEGEITQTSLVKSSRGLGFTIVGGSVKDTQFLQIKNVVENGPAHISGKFKTGDVIVRVNNTCVLGFTHQDAVRLFQSISPGETVQLETCRGYPLNFDPDDPNTEIVTTVAVTPTQDVGSSSGPSTSMGNGIQDPHSYWAGMKPLPDLTRSAVDHGHNSTLSLSHSSNYNGTGVNIMNHDDTIPDLVSLSIMGRPEILTIPIVKGPMGFGFTIADSPYGQRVKQILDPGRCKNLIEGDLLVLINSVNVRDLPHQQTVQFLKECKQEQETIIVVQRGGMPPPGKGKKQVKMSWSFDERQQQVENNIISPEAYFFQNQEQNCNERLKDSYVGSNGVRDNGENVCITSTSLPPPIEEADEESDVTDGEKIQNKTPSQSSPRSQRSRTQVDGGCNKTPVNKIGSPRQQAYMDMKPGRREYQDSNDFSKFSSNQSRADVEGNTMNRPPPGPNRPDFFPRFDPRVRNGDARGDHLQRAFHAGSGDDRWGYGRDVKPGQFRSRTPGPELMARGNSCLDNGRPDPHRPKTPTAADMRGKPLISHPAGPGEFKASGRYTPNPSSEQGRQYRSPYPDYGRNWPEFSPPGPHPGYEPFESSSLNRSYVGEFARPAYQNSVGPGRPAKQSTSFEGEKPMPSTITRVPKKPPPHPTFQGLSPRSQNKGPPDEESGQVMEMLVTLHRQESGYGFRIIGGTEESSQVSVGHIVPGGAADVDGRLQENDEITHVDGCSVLNASHHKVVELMTNAALNGRVTLSIKRVLKPGDPRPGECITPQYPFDVVVSRRENEGFGFVIISSVNKSGTSVDEFIDDSNSQPTQAVVCPWIGHIQDNSPAARCGRLHVGDRILAVNGIDTSNMHHKDVVGLIKDSGFSVALTIGPPSDENSSTLKKSPPGTGASITVYPVERPDMNIQSWERNQSGMTRSIGRPKIPSNKTSDESDEIYHVELHRGSRGFGFSIRGGREFNSMPLYVLRIAEGGAADLDGRLRVGDQILQINSCNTDSMTHSEAIEIIQNGGASVKLVMRRTNKPPPVFGGLPPSPGGRLFPNIPPVANGPISHSSPHLPRRQLPQHQQPLPPPPPELQQPDCDYYQSYPLPPPPSTPQQHQQFNY